MIPTFPEFKKLELSDREEVESFTKRFPPYSDFNFVSMWGWDVKGDMEISNLNNNLVVRFTDYLTGEPFYSFLGDTLVTETATELLTFAREKGMSPVLKLLPEETAKLIQSDAISVREDRDNFDYIHKIDDLKQYAGADFKQKRQEVNSFLQNNPDVTHRELDLRDVETREHAKTVFCKWAENKKQDGELYDNHEELFFLKLLSLAESHNLVSTGVFRGQDLLGFMVTEPLPSGYTVGHAAKTDSSIKGVNAYLMKANSEILTSHGCHLLNYEQDLGLPNLRDGKNRFRPVAFLKKYQASLS